MKKLLFSMALLLLPGLAAAEEASGTFGSSGGTSGAIQAKNIVNVLVTGTFDGSTITLQRLGSNGTWYAVPNAAWTSTANQVYEAGSVTQKQFRLVMTDEGASTSVYYELSD